MDPRIWSKFVGGGFPQKSLYFNMAHLEVIKTGIYYYSHALLQFDVRLWHPLISHAPIHGSSLGTLPYVPMFTQIRENSV